MNLLDLARAEIGVKEVTGNRDNPVIMQYYADAGHPHITHDETPWCAAFVGAILKKAGLPNTGLLTARSYLTYGVGLQTPEPGCIVVMTRGNPNSWEGHVGFYVEDAGPNIKVLGGNQSNSVSIASFPKAKVLAYRNPVEATPKAIEEAGSEEMAMIQKTSLAVGGIATVATGLNTFTNIIQQNAIVFILALCVGGYFLLHWWKNKRIDRHVQGQPISSEM